MRPLKLLLLLILISACGGDQHPDKNTLKPVVFRYTWSYDENANLTIVTAAFFEEENNVGDAAGQAGLDCRARISRQLEKGASISFNGEALQEQKSAGGHYQYAKEIAGFAEHCEFVWKDADGTETSIGLPGPRKIGFPSITTFNANFELSFPFTGSPLGKRESVHFTITDSKGKEHHNSHSGENKTSISCPVNQTYADGPAEFSMTRTADFYEEPNGRRGQISLRYKTKCSPINIVSSPKQSDPPVVSIGNNPF